MIGKRAISASSAAATLVLATAIGLASFSAQATGNTKTATFQVSLSVLSDCAISANPLAFGNANSALATTAINVNTTISVTCTTGTTYSVSLDKGTTTGSLVTARLLAGTGSNTSTVQYQLYSNSGLSAIWGDSTGGAAVGGTGTGSAVSITVFGVVPPQPIPVVDTYTSTETATITF
jgi:spore coat protein U-like protein